MRLLGSTAFCYSTFVSTSGYYLCLFLFLLRVVHFLCQYHLEPLSRLDSVQVEEGGHVLL